MGNRCAIALPRSRNSAPHVFRFSRAPQCAGPAVGWGSCRASRPPPQLDAAKMPRSWKLTRANSLWFSGSELLERHEVLTTLITGGRWMGLTQEFVVQSPIF